MPRQARIDAPGAVHHIICRGIERRKIFRDDTDRGVFLRRLGGVLSKSSTRCYAWTLIPNHFHLLLQTGKTPISAVMRRLLTGYAGDFNRRHNRVGHVFQNRYKSILCQEEPYLLELVRYIHLNPLRAHLVTDMRELATYPYCGHHNLLAEGGELWQETHDVLLRFHPSAKEAAVKYEAFVAEGLAAGRRPDLIGGGLVRSVGGWQEVMWARRSGTFFKSDERILGDSDFVQEVLEAAEERAQKERMYRLEKYDLEKVAQRVAELLDVALETVTHRGKKPAVVQARSLLCYWATSELGMTETELAKKLGLTQSAISRAAIRGEQLAAERGWPLKA